MPATITETPELTLDDAIEAARAGDTRGLVHEVCDCSPDVARCGTDMTGADYVSVYACGDDCIVCAELVWQPCPRCRA